MNIKPFIKNYKKCRTPQYKEQYSYKVLIQFFNAVKFDPSSFYHHEALWEEFCTKAEFGGVSYFRQIIARDQDLFREIQPHLTSEKEQELLERLGTQKQNLKEELQRRAALSKSSELSILGN